MFMKYEYRLIFRVLVALIFRPQIFYIFLTAPTIMISFILLKLAGYSVVKAGTSLIVNNVTLNFVEACVASSAYYLLLFLILLTKDIRLKTAFEMFFLGSLIIFSVNIIRIFVLIVVLLEKGYDYFNLIHLTFWYGVASVLVFLVWVYLTKKYKIKNIPVYSDVVYLASKIKRNKKKTKEKKTKK